MKTAIIIVNYKTPWHLNECLNSIFKHTSNFHIILVHNSKDAESLEVTRKFTNKYPNEITVIQNEKNLGLVGGVNSGYEEGIKYERICFLNSDVIVTKGWLDELNLALDENPNALQVAPDLNHNYDEGRFWKIIRWQLMSKGSLVGSKIYKNLLKLNAPRSNDRNGFSASNTFYHYCTGACNLVRTEPFKKRGYFWDPNIIHGYGDDFDTSYYLRQFGEIGVTNRSYVFHFTNISFNKFHKEREVLKGELQRLNWFYIINKWEDRIKNDLKSLSREELLTLSDSSPEIQIFLKYFGILNVDPEFKEFIKTIPAKKVGERLLN